MKTILPLENQDALATIQGFFKKLLLESFVDVMLVPMRTPSRTVTPALVSNPELLVDADPLAPVMPVNSATLLGQLSVRPPRAKVGAVVRACEARALIELVKLQQASLDELLVINLDCAGTYNVPTFIKKQAAQSEKTLDLWQPLYQAIASQPAARNSELRAACQICEQPLYPQATIRIALFDDDWKQGIPISLPDEMGRAFGLTEVHSEGQNSNAEKLVAHRTEQRDQIFKGIRERLEGEEGIAGVFAACIRCHNCMTVCPICYCKTCVFKSAVFDHAPMQFIEWTKQKGAYRMPADTMLFHLTRMNHMALSCVGCGMCTEACPAELPVGDVFRAIGQRVQQTFDYLPGRDVSEPLPLVTFKADEWTEIGE